MTADLMQYLEPQQRTSAAECEACRCQTCADALAFFTELAEIRQKEKAA